MKKRTVYMAVTNDRYELPLGIGDTLGELEKATGIKRESISSMMCHYKHNKGGHHKHKFIKVVIEDG